MMLTRLQQCRPILITIALTDNRRNGFLLTGVVCVAAVNCATLAATIAATVAATASVAAIAAAIYPNIDSPCQTHLLQLKEDD